MPLTEQLAAARSLLFFPGDDVRKGEKAAAGVADAIVFDLEDGVAPEQKDAARALLTAFLEPSAHPTKLVRVNDPTTALGQADLDALAALPAPAAVVVPKAGLASVQVAAASGRPLVALIEDAAGLRDAHTLAAHPAVEALALGSADLGAALGLHDDGTGHELVLPRATLVVAASAAGIRAPFDGPCLDVHDAKALQRETLAARNLGLRGKICIHPGQVAHVHRCFAPSAEEVDWARSVLASWQDSRSRGQAVGTAKGALVDLPVVHRAQAVLDSMERSEPNG